MWTLMFWKEAAERALKTGAQALVLGLGLGEGLNIFDMDWMLALGFLLGGVLLSILTSVISAPIGKKGSASSIT